MTTSLIPSKELQPGPATDLRTAFVNEASLPGRTEILGLGLCRPALTVSIFLPMMGPGGDLDEDRDRLSGLIDRSWKLIREGYDERRANALLASMRSRIVEPAFWTNWPESLALITSGSAISEFRLPVRLSEQVVVCNHPHIKPLMPLVQSDVCFFLLMLTPEGVRLMAGSRRGLHLVPLQSVQVLNELVCGEGPEVSSRAMRCINAPTTGVQTGSGSFGSDASAYAQESAICRIDCQVTSLMSAERLPLIIAGNEQVLKAYWTISRYPRLLSVGIAMDSVPATIPALHACAWGIIARHVTEQAEDARKRYWEFAGTRRASTDIASVLSALVHDRVADVFIASDCEFWGSFDAVTLQIREHNPRWPCDDDLLNLLLIHASTTHAHVQVVPRTQLPGGGLVAAVFRP